MIVRKYISLETYRKVIEWAIKDYLINNTRDKKGKKIIDNFTFALDEYIKRGCKQ